MPKRDIQPVQDGRLRLRLLQESDLPLTLRWRNQDHIRRWFFFSEVITPQQHAGWFDRYRERDDDFVFIIEYDSEDGSAGQPVGQVALYNVDWAERQAEFGRLMIGEPAASGKGLGLAATRLALEIAFQSLSLEQVYLEVLAENRRAIAIYETAGFKVCEMQPNIWRMSIQRHAV